jgi:hypothetical protein
VRHGAGLTGPERARGEAYWRARFERAPAGGADAVATAEAQAAALWREMVAIYRAPRASWIVRVLKPTNLAALGQPGAAPAFPQNIEDVTSIAKQPYATALPDRFCAVGMQGKRQVFRVWGTSVPDVLPMGPLLDPNAPPPPAAAGGIYGDDRRWLVDFDAAVAAGMGLVVREDQLARGFAFDQGVDRLIVMGVDWTLDAGDSAASLSALFHEHHAASELAFVPLGTPTNNTGRAMSGYTSDRKDQEAPAIDAAPAPGSSDATDLLRHAFGLDAGAFDAANIQGSGIVEQRTAMHMINALWRATLGRYLSLMLNPWYPAADAKKKESATDEYVPRGAVDALREFALRYLRPAGPLPAFRIEKQPYGVLPVVAPSYVPGSSIEAGVRKVVGALRPRWVLSSKNVPHLVDGDLETVTEILQTAPWSRVMQYRGVDDPLASYQTPKFDLPGQELSIGHQQSLKAEWTAEILGLFGITKSSPRDAMIDNLVLATDPTPMTGVPWIEADPKDAKRERAPHDRLGVDMSGQNYIHGVAGALGLAQQQAKSALNARQSGTSLLESMLAFAAEEELDQGAISIVQTADKTQALKPYGRTLVSQIPAALVNVEAPLVTEGWREIRTTRELARARIPSVTGGETIEDHLARGVRAAPALQSNVQAQDAASRLIGGVSHLPYYFRDLSQLKASLTYLADRTVGELDIAFKTTLDAYAYRLDAWSTALATCRLEAVRGRHPTGVHLGAFGWVEGLPAPSASPDSLGFVHAPSLTQAAAAAILRSGHLANHESAKSSFNMDLSSARVQRATAILEGVSNGQSLAALLGYRFERALRDALLGHYALPFRRAFPLTPAGDDPGDGPKETIAARDVVDGVKLLERFEQGIAAVADAVVAANVPQPPEPPTPMTIGAADRAALERHLEALAATWDAVSDLLVAEGVYQVAQGNLERAGAALAVLDKQVRPIEPQVARTPRKGISYAQRVLVACESPAMSDAWAAAGAGDLRAQAEPLLNAWVARMLGAPERFVFRARVLRGGVLEPLVLTISPHQLGWSPLTLVLASRAVPSGGGQHSALRARIAGALAAQVAAPDADTSLVVDPHGQPGGALGLAEFEALTSTLAHMIETARPLGRKDIVLPRDEIEVNAADEGEFAGADLAEIEARAAAAVLALTGYLDSVRNAPDAVSLTQRLADGWSFGLVEAQPATAPDAPGEDLSPTLDTERLAERQARALAQGDAQLAAAAALAPDAPAQAGARHGARVQNAIDRLKSVFGRSFPVLVRFTLGAYAAEVSASLAQQGSLTNGDPLAVSAWFPKLARVREGTDRLNASLTAHEVLVAPLAAQDFKIAQLPFRDQACWAALPKAWENPELDSDRPHRQAPRLAWVAHAPAALEGLTAGRPLAGLLIDEWQEHVPSAWQTTGISFHYDAPGSRPPQSILLAVPPRLGMENWTFDTLLATVEEAFDLARLRAVRPQDLTDSLGLLLPCSFLPENPEADVPSVRLADLVKKSAAKYGTTVALGKA